MAFNKNEPTGDGDFSLRDDAIRANFAALETCIGQTNLSDGETLFDTSDGHDHDGTNSKKVTGQLGDWVSKSNDTVYQAETDGIVLATCGQSGAYHATLLVKSDGSNPPTTVRAENVIVSADNRTRETCTVPVRKNDYYKVEAGGGAASIVIFWLPLGS